MKYSSPSVETGTKPSAPNCGSETNSPDLVTAGDAPVELFADAFGQMVGDQPVDGVALGGHGAALEGRDFGGDIVAAGPASCPADQAAFAEPERADQARWTIRSA